MAAMVAWLDCASVDTRSVASRAVSCCSASASLSRSAAVFGVTAIEMSDSPLVSAIGLYLRRVIGFGCQNSGSASIHSFAGIPQYGRTANTVSVAPDAAAIASASASVPAVFRM